jgi:hypothetical protein
MSSCSQKFFILLLLFCGMPLLFLQNLQAQEPSAEEIKAKSQQAMSQPLRYTIVCNGVEMLVYQKALSDGSIAMLTDIQSPIKKTTIKYGEKHYDLYLEQQVAIDMSGIMQNLNHQFSSFFSDQNNKIAKDTIESVKVVSLDGKECYEILSATAEAFPSEIPDKPSIKSRLLIDKEYFLMREQEIFAKDGSTSSKLSYKDIQPQPNLTDDFFQLPPDLKILSPKSMKEYTHVVMELFAPKLPSEEDADAVFEKIRKKVEEGYPSGYHEIKPPLVAPPTPLPEHLLSPQYDSLPEKAMRPWATIISINVFFIMCITWLIYRKRNRIGD